MAGRSEFEAEMSDDRKSLFIKFGEKGNSGFLLFDKVSVVWDRYWALEQNKYKTGHYSDPKWKKTPNRILSPYIAALIRDFENDIASNFPIRVNPVSLPIVTNNNKKEVSIYKSWAQLASINTYQDWIKKIGEHARLKGFTSSAEWELDIWNRYAAKKPK